MTAKDSSDGKAAGAECESRPDLSIVMPAYNEGERIGAVVDRWTTELDRLGVDYELVVYDDGSTDRTPQVLAALSERQPRLRVERHPNMGHGPTILRGYREARGPWVLQVDGDGEVGPEAFETLWTRRHAYDFLIGCRVGRRAPWVRRLTSAGARLAVRLLFGARVVDVNSPCRLMRRDALVRLLPYIPSSTFAPNVALTGLAARAGVRVFQAPVLHRPGGRGTGAIAGWKACRIAARSLGELVGIALTGAVRKGDPPHSVSTSR